MSFPAPTPKQARVLWFSLTSLAMGILLLLVGLLCWGVGTVVDRISSVLLPAILALILAYILDPVVEFFVRKRMPRIWAILLLFLLVLLGAGAVIGSVIPGVIKESRTLAEDLPKNVKSLQSKWENFLENNPLARQLPAGWRLSRQPVNTNGVEATLDTKATDKSGSTDVVQTNGAPVSTNNESLTNIVNSPLSEMIVPGLTRAGIFITKWLSARLGEVGVWVELLIGLVLVPVYLFYFLLEKKGITRSWTDYLHMQESKAKDEVVFVLSAINDCMIVFFRGQVLVASCVGVLLAVAYLILGLNYAVLLGLVAGLLGIVPYLGTVVSLLLALLVATVQFGDWTHPLGVLGIAAGVKLMEDFVISPKIIGNRSGLHPLTIIFSVMIGAKLLGGFVGAMLAVPLTAALRTLMFRYVWKQPPSQPIKAVKHEEPAGLVS